MGKKTLEIKKRLWSLRKMRKRAPVWAIAKSGKLLLPRFSRLNWRRVWFGKEVRKWNT